MSADDTSVRVATRIRPQLAREKIDMCRTCTFVTPGEPQITLGQDRAFTYDHVFDMDSTQDAVYNESTHQLIEGCFDGYNATVFAYGQTGSGKTYTMGTGFDVSSSTDERGIIPRAVSHLFNGIDKRRKTAIENGEPPPEFKVHAQFMELYNEEIIDLLDAQRDPDVRHKKSHIKIHEDALGGIYTVGVTSKLVTSIQETMQSLHSGALSRTTASTNMNAQSSRSHAIFTLHIKQQRMVKSEENENKDSELEGDNNNQNNEGMSDFETLTAKFHFVDLAGSERLKRTGATGERAKEGISINCGLLALGNVISALGDKSKKASHVPYRDSKLTRLLQDSLGGNSRTLMIACVSPTDRDFMETLNALKYANRARNIKNKVSVNQDKSSRQIAILRVKLQELELELAEYKQGKRIVNEEGVEEINDLFHENTMLQTENNNLRTRIKALQDTIEGQTARISMMLAEQARYAISNLADGDNSEVASMIEGYIKEIEEFRSKVLVLESENARLRRKSEMRSETPYSMNAAHVSITTSGDFSNMEYCESPGTDRVQAILEEAKKDVEKMKQMESGRRSRLPSQGSDKENEPDDERDVDEGEGEGDGDGESADDILDEGEESSSSSDESDSEDKEETQLQEDLAELSCEINIKQKLIEELEISQKRLSTLKMQYEEKMAILENRIKDTQVERDRVLHNLGSIESHSQEKAHKIKEEYEKKIRKMKDELKKLDVAQKEHAKLLRHKSQYERQMKTLSHELDEMKKSKTRLMKNIREEQQKSRERDLKKNREMIQLKKEYRKKDSKIKTLEAEKRQKEIVLRRKQEEVASLRRLQKSNMSDKAAGRVTKRADTSRITNTRDKLPLSAATRKKHQRKGTSEYSTKAAKHKWQSVDKRVQEIVTRRQTILCMEDDMERFMHHRKLLCKDRDKLRRKFKTAQSMGQDNLARDYREQIDSISANIDYVQENIQECQANLVEMTETKDWDGADEGESLEATAVINSCTLTEGRYLLEHFLTASIDRGLYSAQRDAYVKELEAKTHQMEQQLLLQQQLLQHVISETDQADLEVEGLLSNPMAEQSSSSSDSSANPSPVDNSRLNNLPANNVPFPNAPDVLPMPPPRSREKARRRTAMATCEDLLYAAGPTPGNDTFIPVSESEPLTFTRNGDDKNNIPDNILMPPPPIRSHSVPKNASSVNNNDTVRSSQSSDSEKNKSIDTDQETNPRPRRGSFTISRTNSSLMKAAKTQAYKAWSTTKNKENLLTPPGSPPMRRRFGMDGKNVFSRLSKSNSPKIFHADRGVINAYTGRQSGGKPPLICTHTAEGHTKAVLTVQATEDLLFSGSKDRTVKVWSLETGQEVLSLVGHPNNVVSVKYCEKIGLAFSVSTSYIKIWDIRDGHSTCIKTLSSSGHTLSGGVAITGSRTVAVPAGETSINAIALNESGTMLYSAAGSTVRFWDLRSFQAIGKLVGGHSAAVMTMAVEDADHESDLVITGSKDHYIKVFEVPDEAGGVVTAKHNLEPPHYDGIQSLSISGHTLFSGSRDMCIKKWNLNNQQLLKSINSAHKDWICALEQLPERNCLLSGCRGGILKLWQISDCNLMGEIKAHTSPINAISSNSNCIFTASSDRTVSIWRARGSLDSPSSDTPTDKEEA